MPSRLFLLRNVLLLDAATCLLTGAMLTFGARVLAQLTAIPTTLLLYAGVSLIPIAAFMAVTAMRAVLLPLGVWIVIVGNALWVAASVGLMIGPWIAPNAWGYAFIAAQAAAVAVLTKLELDGTKDMVVAA
jgi:hypothetical protein